MGRLRSRLLAALPASLGRRIRWLFAAFTVLVAGLAALGLASAAVPVWPRGVVVLTALAVIAGWAVAQYRRDGLPGWADLVPIGAVCVAGVAFGNPAYVFGMMFVLLYGRALYGRPLGVWLNAAGYFVAYEAAAVATLGWGAVAEVGTVSLGLGIVFSTGVMWLLGDVIRSSERETRRAEVLARTASRLQQAETHDEVYETATTAAAELVDVPGITVTLSRGDQRSLRTESHGGAVPEEAPRDVHLGRLPTSVRDRLATGQPFLLDESECRALQAAVGVPADFNAALVAPLTDGTAFTGALSVTSADPLPTDLAAALGRLAADVGLALDRADSTLLLRQVVDNSSDAILLVDPRLRIDFASPAIESLLGYPPEEVRGCALSELFAHDGSDVRAVLDRAVLASARRDPDVVGMRHADGATRSIELAATVLPHGRRRGLVVNLRDVTQRIAADQELRDSRQRFRSLAENLGEGLYRMRLRPEPSYEYVNPAMEEMTGFPAQSFLEDPSLTLRQVRPEDAELLQRTRVAGDSVEWPAEVRWDHPERGPRWLSFHETVLYDAAGRPVESTGIVSDITARKEEEQALHRALDKERVVTDELRRIDAMRTTFLQAVSHELRTPLTIILGYSQTLNAGRERLAEGLVTQMLGGLQTNAEKLDQLLSDLLDVDRLSSGTVVPVRQRVDVAELCRRVVEQTPSAQHPVSAPDGSLTADVDPAKVERIVANLLGNAVKHTPADTPIAVAVEPHDDGNGVVISVTDRGPGVPRELRDTIFDPFVQGPESSTAPQPGTGIGLAIVARFAELHAGRAWLEVPVGGGTRFAVWLPSDPAASPESQQRHLSYGAGRARHRRG